MVILAKELFFLTHIASLMNILRSWREQKILLKRRFPILSDEDLSFEEGHKESMLEKLEVKLGKSKTELERIFAELQLS